MLENFHLEDNQSENQSKNLPDDQPKKIQPRRSDKKRRALKLVEEMIQYDPRKKMPRADMITIRDKFAYKKIPKCLIHMTRVLATLTADQADESQTLKDVTQRPDWSEWHDAMKREFNSLARNQTWDLVNRFSQNVITDR